MATASIERTDLLALAQAEAEAFLAWQNSDDDHFTTQYRDAMRDLIEEYEGEIPAHAAQAYSALEEAYEAWLDSDNGGPSPRLKRTREDFQTQINRKPPELTPLPTMAELINDQKLTPRQAAKVWKLLDRDKSGIDHPRTDLVQAELDNPGSVITPEYVAHVNRIRLAEAGFGEAPASIIRKNKLPDAVVKQPLEQLLAQRAPLEQIATIKVGQYGGTAEDWLAVAQLMAGLMGIDAPASGTEMINKAGKADAAARNGKESLSVPNNVTPTLVARDLETAGAPEVDLDDDMPAEQQIVELSEGGHDPKAIAKHLNLPLKKVKAVLAKAQAEEEAGDDEESEDDE